MKLAEYKRNYDYEIAQETAIGTAAAEALAQQQVEEQAMAKPSKGIAQPAEEPDTALLVVETQGGYVSGTCKDLKASGVGSNFTPGNANYTSERDRDNDGIACES